MENELVKKSQGLGFCCSIFTIFTLEFFGTLFLVYAVNLQMMGGHAFAIPLALLCGIWISGPITGGHLNPAVSIGVYIIRWRDACRNIGWMALYWCA